MNNEGNNVGDKPGSVADCKEFCRLGSGCNSFAYCGERDGTDGTCHLKDKLLGGFEDTHYTWRCETYYSLCGNIMFVSLSLVCYM